MMRMDRTRCIRVESHIPGAATTRPNVAATRGSVARLGSRGGSLRKALVHALVVALPTLLRCTFVTELMTLLTKLCFYRMADLPKLLALRPITAVVAARRSDDDEDNTHPTLFFHVRSR